MNLPRPPPAWMCLLPGPWQDSQPVWPAILAPSMCTRACGLAANARVILVWQSQQARLPAYVAPGISGGTTIVEVKVEQERSAITLAPASIVQQVKVPRVIVFF